ncbi:MAG: histidine kinase internal region [Gemmatimonadetes bacterium]|nr:histidine kinase internal region [Gemmatimonadota bacterium]
MRSETSPTPVGQLLRGTIATGVLFVAAHAALIKLGKEVAWPQALAFAATNGLLWFIVAPLVMLLGRALGRGRRIVFWQVAIGGLAAPIFGSVQGYVAIAMQLRSPVSALASAFYYLDLNVAVLVLAAVALDVYTGRLALAEHARRHLALEARLLEVRHDLLTLQLQPHFLFNALNSVVALVREAPADAARVLRDLRTLFLATTKRSSHAAVSLAEELEVVDAFVSVARARHADTLVLTREIEEAALGGAIPPLSLQPLVENAIQFALASDQDTRTVALHGVVRNGRLSIRVTNSCGDRDRPTPGLGIGLRNTRERLGHLFGADYSLTLSVSAGVAVAELDVPFVPVQARPRAEASELALTAHADDGHEETARDATPARRWRAALPATLLIAGFWMLAWIFWAFQMHFYRVARGITTRPIFASGMADLVSAISWMALSPIALFLGRHFPVSRDRRAATVLLHVGAALASSAGNIGIISAVYGFREIPMNNVLNQVVVNCAIYALIVVWMHAEQIGRWFDERQTATRRLEAELAHARWDAMALKLPPEAIAGELERLAVLVEVDAFAAEEEVLDMADTLRRMLKGTDNNSSGARRELSAPTG